MQIITLNNCNREVENKDTFLNTNWDRVTAGIVIEDDNMNEYEVLRIDININKVLLEQI